MPAAKNSRLNEIDGVRRSRSQNAAPPMQIGNSQLEFRDGSFPKLMIASAPHEIKAIPSAIA